MKIQPEPPLVPLPMTDIEPLYELADYFRDENFDTRYLPKLEWFIEGCSQFESVLNLGCSRGRETFALTWCLRLVQAVGVEIDYERIRYARKITRFLSTFRHKYCTQNLPSFGDRRYVETLQTWCEGMPTEIREGNLPEFVQEDISRGIAHPDNSFDLIYSRYTLWKLMERQGEGLLSALRDIARIVKLEMGRVVLVEPEQKGEFCRDYLQSCLAEAGLTTIKTEDNGSRLGGADDPDTNPIGYILAKLRA